MQEWKRTRLGKANLKIPEELRFVAVDLERQELLGSLGNAGVRLDEPTFFTWLGVVPYLTPEAVTATLTSIAGVPKAEVVFDYGQPPEAFPLERRAGYLASLASTAAAGEPWRSFFQPTELATKLSQLGFAKIEDLGARELALRYAREPGPVEEAYHMAHFRVKEPTTIHLRPPPPQLMV
jgi:methyltransferase (TIGR00027 family)